MASILGAAGHKSLLVLFFRKEHLLSPVALFINNQGKLPSLCAQIPPSDCAVEMYFPGNSPSMERLAIAFRDSAKQAGVTVSLIVMPQDKFFAELEGKVALNVDQFLGALTPDLILYDMYHSGGAWNDGLWHYHNSEIDALLDEARATTDQHRQAQLYGRFQEITCKDGPAIVVYVQSLACGVGSRLRHFAVTPLQLADISKVTIAA